MPHTRIVLVDDDGIRQVPSVPVRLTRRRAIALDGSGRTWSLETGKAVRLGPSIDFDAAPPEVLEAHEWCVANRLTRRGRPPVDWELARRLWEEGLTDVDIAERVNRSSQTVADWRRGEGLPSQRRRT